MPSNAARAAELNELIDQTMGNLDTMRDLVDAQSARGDREAVLRTMRRQAEAAERLVRFTRELVTLI